jgi:hypothetical protein
VAIRDFTFPFSNCSGGRLVSIEKVTVHQRKYSTVQYSIVVINYHSFALLPHFSLYLSLSHSLTFTRTCTHSLSLPLPTPKPAYSHTTHTLPPTHTPSPADTHSHLPRLPPSHTHTHPTHTASPTGGSAKRSLELRDGTVDLEKG